MQSDNTDIQSGDPYHEETKARWGETDAYKQSVERVKKMSKEDLEKISAESEALLHEIAKNMPSGVGSPETQSMIKRHYEGLRHFYEPTPHLYRGLADMYVSDPRFCAYYEKFAPGLAEFMRDAMLRFADTVEIENSKTT